MSSAAAARAVPKKKTPSHSKSAQSKNKLKEARESFGLDSLRPGQEEAINSLVAGKDTLVVMPTGSGKSAIYQVAALMFDGVTLVVSPLIALQKDQVDSINNQDPGAEAVVINSTQRASETREATEKIEAGSGKFIFLAPEQLRKEETFEMLEKVKVSLFVVDEAHCVSEWGHDFRLDYLQLGLAVERLRHPVVLAMTATASPEVRDEIAQRLGMRDPAVFVHGFDRPNIHLRVDRFNKEEKKLEALVHRVRWAAKPGIVYVATRKNAEEIMRLLQEEGVRALFYHGGLKACERTKIQEDFMAGDAEVIVATNAFGMGINKADVRFVYHYDVSDSLDCYYQEIGRGGRDGDKAEAILFFRSQDLGLQKFRSCEGKIEPEQIEQVAELIAEQHKPVKPEAVAEHVELSERKLTGVIHRLEDVGAISFLPTGEVELADGIDLEEAAHAAAHAQECRKQMKKEKIRQMQEYADTARCRREHLLRYFGDQFTGPCNNCDNCEAANPGIKVDPSLGIRREVV